MAELCYRCGGSGLYMGNGMIMTPCDKCNGKVLDKVITSTKQITLDKVDRRSKSYRDTINTIMQTQDINHDEAVQIFDETYNKI
jgi:DnaJ-class molecular chaperone